MRRGNPSDQFAYARKARNTARLKNFLPAMMANLLVEFVLLGVGLLAHLLSAVTEDVRQTGQRLFLPATKLGRVDAEHLRDLGGRLVRLDGLDGDFSLQARWVTLTRSWH